MSHMSELVAFECRTKELLDSKVPDYVLPFDSFSEIIDEESTRSNSFNFAFWECS